ncbi:MAG: dihydrofolate reductase family protein [Cytophagaceae bacterium]
MRKVVLYIACSVDGYIAGDDDNLDFLSVVEVDGEDYGYAEFNSTVDTLIWGRKTYDKVKSLGIDFPHSDKKVYVVTSQSLPADPNVTFIQPNELISLLKKLTSEEGKDIYCDGGAQTVALLQQHDLIDRYILSIIPIFVGSGVRLFQGNPVNKNLKHKKTTTYTSGLVQVVYDTVRN